MKRVVLSVEMELLSDTIFGCGNSIPGGEDIAVLVDKNGYPVLSGSTFKGLLRESAVNNAVWSGIEETVINRIFGTSDRKGLENGSRLFVSDFVLSEIPSDAESCFSMRTFTKLENGVAEEGTLRTAACINKGLKFKGELIFDAQDENFIADAVKGIKWVGTLRNRGFGKVRFKIAEKDIQVRKSKAVCGRCIKYVLKTMQPLQMVDSNRSFENGYETLRFIPAPAVRGMVLNALAQKDDVWFTENKKKLLLDIGFTDAMPAPYGKNMVPSPMGFYEDKNETVLESVLTNGSISPKFKRAKLGDYAEFAGEKICTYRAETENRMRIQRGFGEDDSKPFTVSAVCSGEEFAGYIFFRDESLSEKIAALFAEDVWMGADRYSGYGRLEPVSVESVDVPGYSKLYGYSNQGEIGSTLYMLALTPFTMVNKKGELCGLDCESLSGKMGVEIVSLNAGTSVSDYDGYNRTWGARSPKIRMFDRGSIFKIKCSAAPSLEALKNIEENGIGVRTNEGYGRVLFIRPELYENVRYKEKTVKTVSVPDPNIAAARRHRIKWIQEKAKSVRKCGASDSQIGTIQALCEKAMANGGNTDELDMFFEKNLSGRGAEHGEKFKRIDEIVKDVLSKTVSETIGADTADDNRLKLICDLFNYSRKCK